MQFSSISKKHRHIPRMGSDIMSSSSPRKYIPQTLGSSSRRLIFEDTISNDTVNKGFNEEHTQKLLNLPCEDEFCKQSDQETEESTSCLKSISDGKTSHDKGLMEIENEPIFFYNAPSMDRFNLSRSPSPRKKINNSPFSVNMKALEKELLNTPAKKPIQHMDDVRTSYNSFINSNPKRIKEGVPRLNADYQIIEVS